MKIILKTIKALRKKDIVPDKRQEDLIKQGRHEFKKLMEKGLSIPVVFL